jgi:hypothetical protein
MVEVEEQLRRYASAVVAGVDPVTAEEVSGRQHLERPDRATGRPRWHVFVAAAAVVALVAVSIGALVALRLDGDDSPEVAGPSGGPTQTAVVHFLDQPAFAAGREPYTVAVDRRVPAASPEAGALDALFAGPTATERDRGLRLVASGATGYTDLRIADGEARLRLTGECSSGGSTFTVAQLIIPTLEQFGIDTVKIYDAAGTTEQPDGPGDSVPICLEP